MKSFRLIICIAVGMMLMIGANGCENKNEKSKSTNDSENKNEKSKSNNKLVLIDFYATWCGPCKAMTPVMDQMEKKYGDRIEFKRIDVDQEGELAQKYDVSSIPNIVILSPDGEVLENIIGYHDADEMSEILSKVLKK